MTTNLPDPELWFARSGASSPRKVFAHYFGPNPRSFDNKSAPYDYWATAYLRASGENGAHAAYGGWTRDRPYVRTPAAGDWSLEDMKWEIRTAQSKNIDGFFVNITSISGPNWDRYKKLVDAAVALASGFKVIPMIDTTGSVAANTPTQVATALGYFTRKSCSYSLGNGHYVIGSFRGEGFPTAQWSSIFAAMTSQHSLTVAFACILLNPSSTNITSYAPISEIMGGWVYGADPSTIASTTNQAALAPGRVRAAGKMWCASAQGQDSRPYTGAFDECVGTQALRAQWARLIDRENADLVQIITWNDFTEGTHHTPTTGRSSVLSSVAAYYIEKMKKGSFPTVLTDVIILGHRDQLLSATSFRSGQTRFMTQMTHSSRTTPADNVEVLTYLTAPATVNAAIGSSRHSYTAPAGEFAKVFPNALGTVSGSVVRSGVVVASVSSPFTVTSNPVSQDRQYFFVDSLHGTDGQSPMMSV